MKKAIVIGSGFSGMACASFLSKAGFKVAVLEKNEQPGGRARQLKEEGFIFDMGPSWYWMPDVFERYFAQFGKKVSDYYTLHRLNPSYRVYWENDNWDIPADYNQLKNLFNKIEEGAGEALDKFMAEALYKYQVGINNLVFKPSQSLVEFLDKDLIKGIFKLDVFQSIKKHVAKNFKNPKLRQLLEFPVLFLGALPKDIPALYSLMNYADIKLGTWYPQDGMYSIVRAMYDLACELGVEFQFNTNITQVEISKRRIVSLLDSNNKKYEADVIVNSGDYQHFDQNILPKEYRAYSKKYWDKRVMAPSCLLYYVGVKKKLNNLLHHSLFFDVPFDKHGGEIYTQPQWPSEPLFYMSAVSKTDEGSAPPNCENLFFLIPVAAGLGNDNEELRKKYFDIIVARAEEKLKENFKDDIVYYKSYSIQDFKNDYYSFKGNAYGLANTLLQTAHLKPNCKSKKINNLFYTGQLTVPGPGVPPSLISGEVVANLVMANI